MSTSLSIVLALVFTSKKKLARNLLSSLLFVPGTGASKDNASKHISSQRDSSKDVQQSTQEHRNGMSFFGGFSLSPELVVRDSENGGI